MKDLEELERAIAGLSKNIDDFPIGAISINDLKPTEEKIRDTRNLLKALSAKMMILRAKSEAQKSSDITEGSEEDTYDELQKRIGHCTINNMAIESCLQNSTTQAIVENSENNEITETLNNIMSKLFTVNDTMMSSQQSRDEDYDKELELKCQLQESLSDFRVFLKQQEAIRKKKLEETNPEIARQKEAIHRRLQKINIMKRLVTNLTAASTGLVKENSILQDLWKKHRELLNIETVQELAKEKNLENS